MTSTSTGLSLFEFSFTECWLRVALDVSRSSGRAKGLSSDLASKNVDIVEVPLTVLVRICVVELTATFVRSTVNEVIWVTNTLQV